MARPLGCKNKDKPLKVVLSQHSLKYYSDIVCGGKTQFELDLEKMTPKERAEMNEKLLKYHTPTMQSVASEISLENNITIEDKLLALSKENDR